MYNWLRFKLWFILELPFFIKEQQFKNGVELGAKAGRSLKRILQHNPNLKMTGIDLWEIIPGGAYKKNVENEKICIKATKKYGERVQLLKGDANILAKQFADSSLDFVFYDLYNFRTSNSDFHQKMLENWLPKIKLNGIIIGRDFHNSDLKKVIEDMGFVIQNCLIHQKPSIRLKYFIKKH